MWLGWVHHLLPLAAAPPQCAPFTVIEGGIADNATSIFHGRRTATDMMDCCNQCKAVALCKAWTFHTNGPDGQHHTCWMMPHAGPRRAPQEGVVSGVPPPPPPPPPTPPAPPPTPAPPNAMNVLMIAVDDLRDEPGGFGGDAHTPTLDRLAKESALMRLNYVQQAVCGPTRASILTSRSPLTTRSVTHGQKCVGSPGSPSCYWREVAGNYTTLPQHFKAHGWHAVSFGKVFDQRTAGGTSCDFPYSWSEPPQLCSTAGTTLERQAYNGASHAVFDPVLDKAEGNMTDQVTLDATVAWLQQRNRSAATAAAAAPPFFLAVGFHRPHLPWIVTPAALAANPFDADDDPPPNAAAPIGAPAIGWTFSDELEYQYGFNNSVDPEAGSWGSFKPLQQSQTEGLPVAWTRELRRFYKAAVTHTDTMIGELLGGLSDWADAENTIVALWGDHGWHLGENGLWGKCTLYESATRAPMMLRIPGLTDGGREIHQLTEHLDLMPTLIEAAGLSAIPRCPADGGLAVATCTQGISLMPLLEPNAPPSRAVRNASLSLWPHPGVGAPQCVNGAPAVDAEGTPCAAEHGTLQFPGSMGFAMVLVTGQRYIEWVNMSYPSWTPEWNQLRAREYYLNSSNDRNLGAAGVATPAQEQEMDKLSAQLHAAASWLGG